jgi:hypothetical protein
MREGEGRKTKMCKLLGFHRVFVGVGRYFRLSGSTVIANINDYGKNEARLKGLSGQAQYNSGLTSAPLMFR